MSKKKLFSILFLFILALFTVFFISIKQFPAPISTVIEKPGHGKASIGGNFDLITSNGKKFSQENIKGKWSLIYFGYTFCPDICPMALENISKALNKLPPPVQSKFQPIFITIDPARDTPSSLHTFIKNFHPNWVALSGSKVQIKKAIKAYRVYSSKVQDESKDTPYYLMDHSSLVYVMNPQGYYTTHFTHETQPDEVLAILHQVDKAT